MPQSLPPPKPPLAGGPPGEGLPGPGARPAWKGWIVLVVLLLGFWAWQYFGAADEAHPAITYTEFYQFAEEGKVESVTLRGAAVTGKLKADEKIKARSIKSFKTMVPQQEDKDLLPLLRAQGCGSDGAERRAPVRGAAPDESGAVRADHRPLGVDLAASSAHDGSRRRALGGMLKSRQRRFETEVAGQR